MHCLAILLTATIMTAVALPAAAECPPAAGWDVTPFLQDGDQRLDYWWLRDNLTNRTILYDGGTESFRPGGQYRFTAGTASWSAPAYQFYRDGARCIDYAEGPRIDYYVLTQGRLTLINREGERFTGLISAAATE